MMKFYLDKNRNKELTDNKISFGRVEAGSSKEVTFYIDNDSEGVFEEVELVLPSVEGLEIVELPKIVEPFSIEPIVLRWSPSLKFEKPLDVEFKVKTLVVYYA